MTQAGFGDDYCRQSPPSKDPSRNLADWFVEQMRKPDDPAEEARPDAFEAEKAALPEGDPLTVVNAEGWRMNSGGYYNRPVADWARQNIRGHVEVRPLSGSKVSRILTNTLLFCVPGAFFALGLVTLALGAKDPPTAPIAFQFHR